MYCAKVTDFLQLNKLLRLPLGTLHLLQLPFRNGILINTYLYLGIENLILGLCSSKSIYCLMSMSVWVRGGFRPWSIILTLKRCLFARIFYNGPHVFVRQTIFNQYSLSLTPTTDGSISNPQAPKLTFSSSRRCARDRSRTMSVLLNKW